MSKKKADLQPDDLLTKDELTLLKEVIDQSITTDDMANIFVAHASKQMLKVIAESEEITLVTHNKQEEFRFPLYLNKDSYTEELKELGPPDIIEHGVFEGEGGRFWRASDPIGLKIYDLEGEYLLGCVVNISTSGMFMLSDEKQFNYIEKHLEREDKLKFYLKVPQRGFHLVSAQIVRVEESEQQQKGLALNFDIDNELAVILHSYIMEQHDAEE